MCFEFVLILLILSKLAYDNVCRTAALMRLFVNSPL